tara:strand:+ start:285 stop:449 length:165 start_codon:yes stop_codon:yes gene_type:complete
MENLATKRILMTDLKKKHIVIERVGRTWASKTKTGKTKGRWRHLPEKQRHADRP